MFLARGASVACADHNIACRGVRVGSGDVGDASGAAGSAGRPCACVRACVRACVGVFYRRGVLCACACNTSVLTVNFVCYQAVCVRMGDSKAMREVSALARFYETMNARPDRATYGYRVRTLARVCCWQKALRPGCSMSRLQPTSRTGRWRCSSCPTHSSALRTCPLAGARRGRPRRWRHCAIPRG